MIQDSYIIKKVNPTLEEFVADIDKKTAVTKVAKIYNANIALLSFKEKTSDGKYVFIEIKEEELNILSNGIFKDFPLKVFSPKSEIEKELFEETASNTGLLMLYQGYIFFMSKGAANQLPNRTGITGSHTIKQSFIRDLFIADSLYNPEKRASCDATSIIVYRVEEVNGVKIRKIFAIMGNRFVFSSLKGLKNIVQKLNKKRSFGEFSIAFYWLTQDYTIIRVEFPQLAEKMSKKYALPDKIIPGIMLTDSDSGHSSFVLTPTYRFENSESYVAMESKSWKHETSFNSDDVWEYITKIYPGRIIELMEALTKKLGKKVKSERIYSAWAKEIQLSAIGQKVEKQIKEDFSNWYNKQIQDSTAITEYDIVSYFVEIPEKFELLQYAKNKAMFACGKTPFLALKDEVQEWEN